MRKAILHLKKQDPVMKKIIEAVGPFRLVPNAEGTHFDHVVRAIVYQQLSGKAAGTIHKRVKELFGGRNPTPKELLATPDERLRAAGLSRQKLSYLRDFAMRIESGEVEIDRLHELEDEAIIVSLTRIKGIGRWTAQMFLMFRLGRPNVLPTVDLGINKAVMNAYGLRRMPNAKQLLKIGAKWAPFATIACWYLWRSLEQEDLWKKPRKTASRKS